MGLRSRDQSTQRTVRRGNPRIGAGRPLYCPRHPNADEPLTFTKEALSVVHRPLPWFGSKTIPREKISAVAVPYMVESDFGRALDVAPPPIGPLCSMNASCYVIAGTVFRSSWKMARSSRVDHRLTTTVWFVHELRNMPSCARTFEVGLFRGRHLYHVLLFLRV